MCSYIHVSVYMCIKKELTQIVNGKINNLVKFFAYILLISVGKRSSGEFDLA